MSETNEKDVQPTEQELKEEEAVRKAAQKLVDEAMEEERKRRVDESKAEVTDKLKLDSLNRLVTVQEQMLRQINLMKVSCMARAPGGFKAGGGGLLDLASGYVTYWQQGQCASKPLPSTLCLRVESTRNARLQG